MQEKDIFENAIKNTSILKMPRRNISTFGITNIDYYLLSKAANYTKIREGKVISQRPEIIKPAALSELFEGFGDYADKYGEEIFKMFGKNTKILNYRFKNQPKTTSESVSSLHEVFEKICEDIDRGDNLAAIIKGDENTWQIAIMKFIIDMTLKSAEGNINELEERGLFPDESGIPQNIRNRIEYLFEEAKKVKMKRNELGKLLNDYGLLKEYEDRFFRLFK